MLRGLYTAATGMMVQQLKQESVSNNLSNADTPGYKRDETVLSSFPEILLARVGNGDRQAVGALSYGSLVDETLTIQQPGVIRDTGRNLDFAVIGKGYFTVESPGGTRYTKNGHFKLNSEGYLVTEEGHFVLGEEGRVNLDGEEIAADEEGRLFSDGDEVGRLRITTFKNPGALRKEGSLLFRATEDSVVQPDIPYEVRNKSLEQANVDLIKEMVDMITVTRAFQTNQRVLQAYDQMLAASATEIGKLG